ncbi:hypothetical protein SAMN05443287_11831 [Micromonospora phaseoli]|uniref:Uncharacterized protein n=1 Tax=Micromonospora phaseoli TaxID=1144548 RepID=A0A1H7DV60_9ACTN|nr:hypothetical protein CLV64_11625 [Micromonospora phaseoli]GIJ80549.1 hypothetical protein Xph01_49810 [Micromonospora phaseoli]SEK05428.1 hypothetical protein SAMN05443287_11831 [Micromonospora phaseoli]
MAKHRAPGDDLRRREEGPAVAAYRPVGERRGPTPRKDWPENRFVPRRDLSDGRPAPRQDRSPKAPGSSARSRVVVGVARVPVTSLLTPPGQELRGPHPSSADLPAVLPAPAGRHRQVGGYDR